MNKRRNRAFSRALKTTLSVSVLGAMACSLVPAQVMAHEGAVSPVLREQSFDDFDSSSDMSSALEMINESPEEMTSESVSSSIARTESISSTKSESSKTDKPIEDADDDKDQPGIPEGAEDNHRKSDVKLDGIDISHWQQGIEPDKIDADFILCKATGGKDFKDKSFDDFAKKILDSGKLFGFYHYAWDNGHEGTPEQEAAWFYSQTSQYIGKGIPVLDFEDRELREGGTDWALRFVNAYYNLSGVKCMIYTSSSFTRSLDWSAIAKEGYPLWVANYGKNNEQQGYADRTYTDEFGTGAFEEYYMHQYTSRGRLEGYSGNLDLNKFFGTKEDWAALGRADELEAVMHRLYNPNSGEHFYTSRTAESNYLVEQGWQYEGFAWNYVEAGDPVYRLYNPNEGDHHYTLDEKERDYLIKAGWNYEGIGWYSDTEKGEPVYRAYNPNAKTGAHHFTASESEWLALEKAGWKREGIAWYGNAYAEEESADVEQLLRADYHVERKNIDEDADQKEESAQDIADGSSRPMRMIRSRKSALESSDSLQTVGEYADDEDEPSLFDGKGRRILTSGLSRHTMSSIEDDSKTESDADASPSKSAGSRRPVLKMTQSSDAAK